MAKPIKPKYPDRLKPKIEPLSERYKPEKIPEIERKESAVTKIWKALPYYILTYGHRLEDLGNGLIKKAKTGQDQGLKGMLSVNNILGALAIGVGKLLGKLAKDYRVKEL
jgi:hypothetical protein